MVEASSRAAAGGSTRLWVDPDQQPLLVWLTSIIAVGAFVMWSIETHLSEATTWDRIGTPALATELLIAAIVVTLRPAWLTRATIISMACGSVFLLGLLIQSLIQPTESHLYYLMSIGQYNPLLYLAAFAMFQRGAPLLCWIHYGATVVVLVGSLWWQPPFSVADLTQAKVMMIVTQPAYIVALGFLVRLRDTMAERERAAHRDKEELLAMISHEIRGPLQTMLSSVDLLDHKVHDPVAQRAVGRLRQTTQQLDRHLRDLMEFTRVGNPDLDVEHRRFDLVSLIDELVDEQLPQAARKGLLLLGPVWDEAPADALERWRRLAGDPLRLRQVLSNLVSNAIKYTDTGQVQMLVHNPDDLPGWVQIDVRDTGEGIPPKLLAQVFEPFMRVRRPDTARIEGSGLGLAIAARLVDRLGGRIRATSLPGQGSCFSVALPLPKG